MTSQDVPPPTPPRERRGLAEKRASITQGALVVFGRDGYTRASIDAIAAEAGVSTRTIYNHFEDKQQLFLSVIQQSATRVAAAQIGLLDRYLERVTDLEADLVALGCAWTKPMAEFTDHFALVRQINAEVGHFPQAGLDAWQETGPRRVHRELALRLRRLADEGRLAIGDADRAATHFVLLVGSELTSRSYFGAIPFEESEVTEIVTAGVRTFLHGYLGPPPATAP
ncbi:TetR/AcrR family transcriptional regulator [Pengzhenrongella sp.]|jgi:AcrR family transcriptional regulator|uniref:TetR/AcrR family transcriptional regulator n=1 Tax=Pengzhenrongella sp. TaxID=2888820 RepID=UPI002F931A66